MSAEPSSSPGPPLPAQPPPPPGVPAAVALPRIPMGPPLHKRLWRVLLAVEAWFIGYFRARKPTFGQTIGPLLLLAMVLYIRHPATNYIFDEQEALLANPYVNGVDGLTFWDAIHRDFWGLPPNASIGSYRPLPNLIWRSTWVISTHPFFHHLYNIVFHALNGALLGAFAFAVTKRSMVGWLTGLVFVSCAVLTEAVSGIVGIADVLGGLGAVLALCALRLPAWSMTIAVFATVLFGLFSKESAMVCVPLVAVAALLTAPMLHPERPARALRSLLAFVSSVAAFVLYVELRRDWFRSPIPEKLSAELPADASQAAVLYRDLLLWFRQAPLPQDPLNNPLADTDFASRVAGALRVYWRGITQVVAPHHLSGDYSFPQEPVPNSLTGWETLAGGAMMVLPLALALGLYVVALMREHADSKRLVTGQLARAMREMASRGSVARDGVLLQIEQRGIHRKYIEAAFIVAVAGTAALVTERVMLGSGGPTHVATWPFGALLLALSIGLMIEGWPPAAHARDALGPWPWRHIGPVVIALGLVWMVVSYFPHSNIPVILPTVRAERFWYFPAIGTSLIIAVGLAYMSEKLRGWRLRGMPVAALLVGMFLGFQFMQAYRHSMDYRDDLSFWRATKFAVPRSAKAHLNYSVMVGARGDLQTRLRESKVAMGLAPEWPMAHIYTGDTLCRLKRPHEAWPHYRDGFNKGPNDRSLIALALQCMYDQKILLHYDDELRKISDDHPGSWIAYLAIDTLDNHEEHKGVDPEYRPRGYNQGPKKEKKED